MIKRILSISIFISLALFNFAYAQSASSDDENFQIIHKSSYLPAGDKTLTTDGKNIFVIHDSQKYIVENKDIYIASFHYIDFFSIGDSGVLEFFADDNNVYYLIDTKITVIQDSDPQSFTSIIDTNNFFKDKRTVYYISWNNKKVKKINLADPESFWVYVGHGGIFPTDKKYFYYYNDKLDTFVADRKTHMEQFEQLSAGYFYTDANDKVYYIDPTKKELVEIAGSDARSFKVVGTNWTNGYTLYKDKKAVYYIEPKNPLVRRLEGADGGTFKAISIKRVPGPFGNYFKDKNSVWYLDILERGIVKIEGANPRIFNIARHANNRFEEYK